MRGYRASTIFSISSKILGERLQVFLVRDLVLENLQDNIVGELARAKLDPAIDNC